MRQRNFLNNKKYGTIVDTKDKSWKNKKDGNNVEAKEKSWNNKKLGNR